MSTRHPLRRARALLGALLLSAAALGAAAVPATAAPRPAVQISAIRAEPDRLSFLLSAQGLPAGATLDPAGLTVTAGGVGLTATAGPVGAAGTGPARVVYLLLDTSGSMLGAKLAAARAAALAYRHSVPADVKVGLIAFSDQPHQLLAPTSDQAALQTALAGVAAKGGTALYDAAATAVRAFTAEGYDATADRRLLILSDGGDTSSSRSLDATARLLAADRIPADAVALTQDPPSPALTRLSQAAGGQVLHVVSTAGLSAAFRESARTVSDQLLVTVKVPARLAGAAATLTVRATVGGAVLTGTAPVLFAAAAAATAPSPTAEPLRAAAAPTGPVLAGWTLWAVLGLFFLALFLLLGVVLVPVSARTRRLGQVDAYSRAGRAARAATAAAEQERNTSPFTSAALSLSGRLVESRGLEERIALDLDRADLKFSPAEWLLLRICVTLGAVALVTLLAGNLPAGLLLGGLLGYVGTRAVVSVRISRRCAAFADRLPDALQLMASSLTSGFSLPQALDALVRQSLPPLAPELGRALAEARIGVPVEDALTKVADRMDSQDLRWTVMTIRIQREVGGNLAEVLLTTAETMRERARVRRHVRALAAEGKLSAYVLVALPVCIGAWMFLTRGSYVRPLYTTGIGLTMLIGAGVLVAAGWAWMLKLAKVEV